jgi:uncharacterized delta-60 repeat protein
VDASGRIVVSATTAGTTKDFLVARFNRNGSLDTTFGAAHTGVVTTDILSGSDENARALALQGDGKIVVGGAAHPVNGEGSRLALARYNPDGTLDATFDGDGLATAHAVPNFQSWTDAEALAVATDGRILTAGTGDYVVTRSDGSISETSLVVAMRFNADGSPDTSYGPLGTGAVLTTLGSASSVSAAALQPDGRLVVTTGITTGTPPYLQHFGLARFLGSAASPSPVQVGSFAAAPNPVAAGSPVTLTADGVTTASAGATVTKTAFYYVDSTGFQQFLGYGTKNANDTWTLTFTVNLAPESYTLLALAVDSTGAVSDPASFSLQVLS